MDQFPSSWTTLKPTSSSDSSRYYASAEIKIPTLDCICALPFIPNSSIPGVVAKQDGEAYIARTIVQGPAYINNPLQRKNQALTSLPRPAYLHRSSPRVVRDLRFPSSPLGVSLCLEPIPICSHEIRAPFLLLPLKAFFLHPHRRLLIKCPIRRCRLIK